MLQLEVMSKGVGHFLEERWFLCEEIRKVKSVLTHLHSPMVLHF